MFHEIRFPADISRGARGGPERRTQIVELASGGEERNASWVNSRRRYDVAYGIRRADDLAAVVAFFEARNGRLHGFRFKDWSDYKSGLPSQTITPIDQFSGAGDGVTTTFQLAKRYVRTHDPRTHKRQATRYILGFEEGFPQELTPETGDGFEGTEDEQHGDPTPEIGHGAISGFSAKPSPDFAKSHLRNPETNLVREPLSKPVKEEEEDARARDSDFDRFFAELLGALGFEPDGPVPGWWQGWPPRLHVQRWRDELGLTEAEIVSTAKASREDHPEPPDGPKALDRAMQRAARCLKQTGAAGLSGRPATSIGTGDTRRRKRDEGPRPGADEQAAFYAELVNSDRFLPANTISTTMRDTLLGRGLVTAERLRQRGVR